LEACDDGGAPPHGKEDATIVLTPPRTAAHVGHAHLSSPNQEEAIVDHGGRNGGGGGKGGGRAELSDMARELRLKSELYGSGNKWVKGGVEGGKTMCFQCDNGGSNPLFCWLMSAGVSSARYRDRAKHNHLLANKVLLHVLQRREVILQYQKSCSKKNENGMLCIRNLML
jgi:hypothetical protein